MVRLDFVELGDTIAKGNSIKNSCRKPLNFQSFLASKLKEQLRQ